MPKIDINAIPEVSRTGYPAPFNEDVAGRFHRHLAGPSGLTDFGVNLCRLEPGAWSSQRHWHSDEDEFVIMVSGDLMLVTGSGETPMRAGDCAAFPAGDADAHHFVNRSDAAATFLVVGTNKPHDACTYPDIDLHLPRNDGPFTRKDGTSYGTDGRR